MRVLMSGFGEGMVEKTNELWLKNRVTFKTNSKFFYPLFDQYTVT